MNLKVKSRIPEGLVCVDSNFNGEIISFDVSLLMLQTFLSEGRVLLFKGAFHELDMRELRAQVFAWSGSLPVAGFDEDIGVGGINFHREDKCSKQSSLPHCFHQYGFGDLAGLAEPLGSLLNRYGPALLIFQNALAGTKYNFSPEQLRIKFLQYFSGAGFLANHKHCFLPQKVGLLASVSQRGVEYQTGGLVFDTSYGEVDTSELFEIGDIIVFPYDLPHEVVMIDPGFQTDWGSGSGRWVLGLELIETHEQVKLV